METAGLIFSHNADTLIIFWSYFQSHGSMEGIKQRAYSGTITIYSNYFLLELYQLRYWTFLRVFGYQLLIKNLVLCWQRKPILTPVTIFFWSYSKYKRHVPSFPVTSLSLEKEQSERFLDVMSCTKQIELSYFLWTRQKKIKTKVVRE